MHEPFFAEGRKYKNPISDMTVLRLKGAGGTLLVTKEASPKEENECFFRTDTFLAF